MSFLCGMIPGAIFGLIGAGSGIFAILLLSYILHIPIHNALPLALLLTFVASLYTVSKNRKSVPMKKSGLAVVVGSAVLMSPVGVFVSAFISSSMLKMVFNIFILFAALSMWPRSYISKESESYITKRRYVALMFTGCIAGLMNALLGVSGGVIIVPALKYIGFDINRSIVTSAYVVLFTTIASLISYFSTRVDVIHFFHNNQLIVVNLVLGCVVGSVVGNRCASCLPAALLKKIFAGVICLIALITIAKTLL